MVQDKPSKPTEVRDMAPVLVNKAFSAAVHVVGSHVHPVVKVGAVFSMLSGAAVAGVGECVRSSQARNVGSSLFNLGQAVDRVIAGDDVINNVKTIYRETSGAVGHICRLVGLSGDQEEQVVAEIPELVPE